MYHVQNLVLTRRETEAVSLTIGPDELREMADRGQPLRIEVQALHLSRSRARLAFQAPESVVICRTELEETPAA